GETEDGEQADLDRPGARDHHASEIPRVSGRVTSLDPRRRVAGVGVYGNGVARLPERGEEPGHLRDDRRIVDDHADVAAGVEVFLLPVAGSPPAVPSVRSPLPGAGGS